MSLQWLPAGHQPYTSARKRRLWVAPNSKAIQYTCVEQTLWRSTVQHHRTNTLSHSIQSMTSDNTDVQTPRSLAVGPDSKTQVTLLIYTHSVSHAHFLCTFPHGSKCLQCACRISPSRFLHSHVSSTVFAVPALSLRHHVPICTVFVELYPTRKRGSSALPHERRGVWLLGRSHALHRS